MKSRTALKTILVIAIIGLLFSGYLTYNELFKGGCPVNSPIRCGTVRVADLPACVYGFVMYLVIFFITLLGLRQPKPEMPAPTVTPKA